MRKHSGMRPQDIAVLLKIIALQQQEWRMIDLATSLQMSPSEVSEALKRSAFAQLIDESKRNVFNQSLLEFLIYGIKYVFPVRPGGIVKGIATAHSAPPLSEMIASSEEKYVWSDVEGQISGQAIEPLYPAAPKAAKEDSKLYELLALIDALRVGKARERELAAEQLAMRIEQK